MEPAQLIRKEYGSDGNFMTPDRLGFGWIVDGRIAYELSGGRGLRNKPIFGVSVVELLPGGKTRRMTENSDCFQSRASAMQHVDSLTETMEEVAP